jgi:GABA(A) receptor-associated protein
MFKKKEIEYNFKNKHTFEQRSIESNKIKIKYPDKIPVIVEKAKSSKIITIDKNKFLIPIDLTVGQFLSVIRKRIKINDSDSIFLFINNSLPCYSHSIGSLYESHQDKDGFLYVQYTEESTFG